MRGPVLQLCCARALLNHIALTQLLGAWLLRILAACAAAPLHILPLPTLAPALCCRCASIAAAAAAGCVFAVRRIGAICWAAALCLGSVSDDCVSRLQLGHLRLNPCAAAPAAAKQPAQPRALLGRIRGPGRMRSALAELSRR